MPRFGPSRFWDGDSLVEPGGEQDGQRDRRPASVPTVPGGSGPGGPKHASRRGKPAKPRRPRLLRRLFAHRSVRVVLVIFVAFVCWVGFSVGQALTAPGNTNTSTRLAEWARDHYLGPVVTFGEWVSYQRSEGRG